MIIVTGGFGFIGSNIIRNLNRRGQTNIFVVDDLENGHKFKNLADCEFNDYFDVESFFDEFPEHLWEQITQIYHEGAISSTTEWNGKLVMERNYKFSDKLLNKAMEHKIPFSYASSASVYGPTMHFTEDGQLQPLNMYAYSKYLFDKKVERLMSLDWYQNSPYVIQGYRYFNVYGDGEEHKQDQASPVHKFMKQALEQGVIKVFEGSENFRRDFVNAEDIAILKIEMLNRNISGIFNAGTGKAVSFMDVANLVSRKTGARIEKVPFPEHLKGHYQEYTQANTSKLQTVGCPIAFRSVAEYLR
jgi:ADP-L-glycero-D-manno-heptose 6-epimerase